MKNYEFRDGYVVAADTLDDAKAKHDAWKLAKPAQRTQPIEVIQVPE